MIDPDETQTLHGVSACRLGALSLSRVYDNGLMSTRSSNTPVRLPMACLIGYVGQPSWRRCGPSGRQRWGLWAG